MASSSDLRSLLGPAIFSSIPGNAQVRYLIYLERLICVVMLCSMLHCTLIYQYYSIISGSAAAGLGLTHGHPQGRAGETEGGRRAEDR